MKKILLLAIFIFINMLPTVAQVPFPIGTKWHYELKDWGPPPLGVRFRVIEVVDTVQYQGQTIYDLDPVSYFIRQTPTKVFYVDTTKHIEYQLYDFEESYTFNIHRNCGHDPDNFIPLHLNLDSITNIITTQDVIFELLHFSGKFQNVFNEDEDSIAFNTKIIKNVGKLEHDFIFDDIYHSFDICGDFSWCYSGIRCFESEGNLYNFRGYPCDTIFSTNNTSCNFLSSTAEINLAGNISIYPNPSMDMIWINSEMKIDQIVAYNIQGELVETIHDKNSNQIDISEWSKGLYLLRIYIDDISYTKKLIKM